MLSEFVQGSKVTMGAPYYNRVAVPIGLFLLFLTGVGPLLAWRSTSLRAIRRNFVLPCIAILVTAIVLHRRAAVVCRTLPRRRRLQHLCPGLLRPRRRRHHGHRRRVPPRRRRRPHSDRQKPCSIAILLTHRNTRRYGGYLIHFGIVVMFIGLAGSAFNQSKELEMSVGDSIELNGYKLVCQTISQDSNANYDADFAILDVFHNGKHITLLTPERRIYFPNTDHAQPSTVVAIHSTLASDLYVVFEGTNADTGRPILKVFLNPLVNWIWIGVGIVIFGTFIALVPPLKPTTRRVEVPSPVSFPTPALGGSLARGLRYTERAPEVPQCLSASSNSPSWPSSPHPDRCLYARKAASTTPATSSCVPAAVPRSCSSATTSAAPTPPERSPTCTPRSTPAPPPTASSSSSPQNMAPSSLPLHSAVASTLVAWIVPFAILLLGILVRPASAPPLEAPPRRPRPGHPDARTPRTPTPSATASATKPTTEDKE